MEMVQESAKDLRIPRASIHRVEADGIKMFYREAGPSEAPVVLLLHGFPSSSFLFRHMIPILALTYHVIAPDFPGFGFTKKQSPHPDERGNRRDLSADLDVNVTPRQGVSARARILEVPVESGGCDPRI